MPLTVTYIGGQTILIELGGLRLLIDPTFDPAGHGERAHLMCALNISRPGHAISLAHV